jgi:hypothetical protein
LPRCTKVVDLAREYEKPLFIAEATPQWYDLAELTFSAEGVTNTGRSAAQIWSDWFEPFFAFISENADVVRGVTYINADWDQQGLWGPPYAMGYWGDTRVQANETILNNWKSALADQGWGPSP